MTCLAYTGTLTVLIIDIASEVGASGVNFCHYASLTLICENVDMNTSLKALQYNHITHIQTGRE